MCGGHEHEDTPQDAAGRNGAEQGSGVSDATGANPNDPPDWENMPLPPDFILAHCTSPSPRRHSTSKGTR